MFDKERSGLAHIARGLARDRLEQWPEKLNLAVHDSLRMMHFDEVAQ
jgi:hypothetical protein